MNLFDAGVVVLAALAGYGGYRQGFAARALSWLGLLAGVVIAAWFMVDVANVFESAPPRTRFIASLTFFVLVCTVGHTMGAVLGSTVHRALPPGVGIRTADRIGGAVIGVVGVLVALWVLTPLVAAAPGWPARTIRGSAIARAVQRAAPEPPSSVRALGRLVGDAPFPEVFRRLTTSNAGAPPTTGVAPDVAARVALSVVRVEGEACDQTQEGSGFAVAAGMIVTNAHVVAGEHSTVVYTADGTRYEALVVAFDPVRDVAVLRTAAPIPALTIVDAAVDELGSVFGHPGGGELHEAPARVDRIVEADGSDIYRRNASRRKILVLAASLRPGDSGSPLVDAQGRVIGVAFAVDPGNAQVAYALDRSEVDPVVAPVLGTNAVTIDTGSCLVG